MKRIKILFIHPNLSSGGAENQLLGLLEYLAPIHDVHLALYEYSEHEKKRLAPLANVSVHPLRKSPGIVATVCAIRELEKIVRKNQIEIIKTYLSNTNILAYCLKRRINSLAVVWGLRISKIATKDDNLKARLTDKLLILLSSSIDLLIANNQTGLDSYIKEGLQPKKAIVIENGIDTSRYFFNPQWRADARKLFGAQPDCLVIGMIARQVKWKGHMVVLQGAKLVEPFIPNLKIVFIGDGPADWTSCLRNKQKTLGLTNNVIWLGDRSDVDQLLNGLDIFTLASTSGEGHSNALVEAIATGIPVVVTDVGDNATIVGEGGLVVPPNHPNALMKAWLKISRKDVPIDEWTARGVIKVRKDMSSRQCYRRMEEALVNARELASKDA
jgi:glycosyltransferase involved in cell wall biosynthesis